ncbi:MAG: helix-turn-helix domain-containing protein [Candidatus Binatia bacterium]
MEEIITPSQVAALLQLNVRTVYRLAQRGLIPGNKIGRGWRFSKSDILDLVSNGQRKDSWGRPN